MRFFGYYALHSFKNQLKKLFKSWVLIFVLACALIGGLIGFVASQLTDLAESQESSNAVIEELAPEEFAEQYDIEEWESEEDVDEGEDFFIDDGTGRSVEIPAFVEAIAGAVLLLILILHLFGADKSGSAIFLPADVSLLFPSPMKPQSVLLFRLMANLGATAFASVYLLFQLPNLILNAGLSPLTAWMILAAWFLSLITARLLQVLIFTYTSTRPGFKRYILPGIFVVVGLVVAGFFLFYRLHADTYNMFGAAVAFFGSKTARWIPLWGWMKGMIGAALDGNAWMAGLFALLMVVGLALLCILIWRLKADFYEEALARSEQTAALRESMEADESGRIRVVRTREKDRSEKIRRNDMQYGQGANVFFFKALYNRRRFAKAGIVTKTMGVYFLVGVLYILACRYIFDTKVTTIYAIILAGFVFYRALGNPLSEDTSMDYFIMIPESMHAKLFYSILGGSLNCLIDILPPMLFVTLGLDGNPLWILPWVLFIVTMDFFATSTNTFIAASTPKNAGKIVKQMAAILFLYFGLAPDMVILILGVILGKVWIAVLAAALVNIVLGGLFLLLTPHFLDPPGGYRPLQVKS